MATGPRVATRGPALAWSDPPDLPLAGNLPGLDVAWDDWDIAPTVLCANLPAPICPRCGWDGPPWICRGAARRPGGNRVLAVLHGFCCPGCRRVHVTDHDGDTVVLMPTAYAVLTPDDQGQPAPERRDAP
jgi:hypothetical protein